MLLVDNAKKIRDGEEGFTLVELAIVMIIVALLIGGILKGQEMIANARVTSSVAQLKGTDAALSTFYDKYNALPGDMLNAAARLPNCNGACSSAAGANLGNGRIDTVGLGTAPTNTSEEGAAFAQLAASELVSGIDVSSNALTFGQLLPKLNAGGGFWVGSTSNGSAAGGIAANSLRNGHYLVLNGNVATVNNTGGALSANQAARIDRKLDDGVPDSGSVWTVGNQCVTAGVGGNIYDEAQSSSTCAMYVRVQQ